MVSIGDSVWSSDIETILSITRLCRLAITNQQRVLINRKLFFGLKLTLKNQSVRLIVSDATGIMLVIKNWISSSRLGPETLGLPQDEPSWLVWDANGGFEILDLESRLQTLQCRAHTVFIKHMWLEKLKWKEETKRLFTHRVSSMRPDLDNYFSN